MDTVNLASPAPRMPLQLDIEYRRRYSRRGEKGRLKNISLSGAFLELDPEHMPARDEKVVLNFNVSGRLRKVQASVIWITNNGCGVKFHHINNRDQQIVDDLMYFVGHTKTNQRTVLDSIFKKVA
jgi:hypothetical protein